MIIPKAPLQSGRNFVDAARTSPTSTVGKNLQGLRHGDAWRGFIPGVLGCHMACKFSSRADRAMLAGNGEQSRHVGCPLVARVSLSSE